MRAQIPFAFDNAMTWQINRVVEVAAADFGNCS
jgi:hypothetical protein